MPRDGPTKDPDEEDSEDGWRGLARDLLVAGLIVAIFLGGMYAYAGNWPPLVVVESASMQHADRESFLGVIDTGDMVFQQAAPSRSSVITYLEGRTNGHTTYGDYGDVIIFNRPGDPTPVIHRAIMYVTIYSDGTADVPDLARLPASEWEATNATGLTTNPYSLETATIKAMGFGQDLDITFDFVRDFQRFAPRSGYVTMGDNNAYRSGYDIGWMPRQEDIIGRARGEIPWFGLLKLTIQPTNSCCPDGWGDPTAPRNSWDALLGSLIFLFALPFIFEFASWGWTKFVAPRLPEIRWPWRRKASEKGNRKRRDKRPPREGSSEP